MIEERGRVVRVDPTFVWVETLRKSTCGKCQANKTCGHGLMSRMMPSRNHAYIRAANRYPVSEGDEVTVALPEHAVVSASFLVYLVPMLTLLVGVVVGAVMDLKEPVVIGLSLAGLLSGFGFVRWWGSRSQMEGHYEPVVLHWHIPLSASESS